MPLASTAMATTTSETTSHTSSDSGSGLIANILTPGSSLHPTFLLILDGAFALLLCVFLGLLFLTRGNIHICALILIEVCLWASVKWYVRRLATYLLILTACRVVAELRKTTQQLATVTTGSKEKEE